MIAEGTDAKGQVVALPTAAYAQALHYNRSSSREAGLNPNKPPTTWAQVEADAKHDHRRRPARPATPRWAQNDNTAGWILTTLVYSLGGRMETGIGTNAMATLDNPQTVAGAEHAEEDALDGQLDGLQLRLRLERHQPGLRRRPGRHVRQRLGRLHEPRPGEQHQPEHLRRSTTIPLAKNKNAGVLGGGTLAAVRPDASTARRSPRP